MAKYAIGMDFGTLSARALVANVDDGREMGTAEFVYPHGVMSEALPDGTPLMPDWALQHTDDYLQALKTIVPAALRDAGVDGKDVVGIGVDFTCSTLIPLDAAGKPLFRKHPSEPHAYPKLWKHHACQNQAERMTEIALERGETWLMRYGGKVSSEWTFPKILQMLEEAPTLYDETARFMEAGDWLTVMMTGSDCCSACMLGYKAFWSKREGFPEEEFFAACHPKLKNVVKEKLGTPVPLGGCAGRLTAEMAAALGIPEGTPVAVPTIDAHVSLPAAGAVHKGDMLMIMGTSTCHIVLDDKQAVVPGMCGAVEDGAVPGLIAFEAGQSCVGDHFAWFVNRCFPKEYAEKAAERNMNPHAYLTALAEKLSPGESGLIALDWWNGNRSVLVDADLTGLMVGMNLSTRPEEIYRALMEATAFGTRVIIDAFEENGIKIERLYACGGIARKNAFLMQLYADILQREIHVSRSAQTPALGSCILGAAAAGRKGGGWDGISEAAAHMGCEAGGVYIPRRENKTVYDLLYGEYLRLHDAFGRGGMDVMKRLKEIKKSQYINSSKKNR